MKKICIIGQGYIGIPTAMVLADQNNKVIGVDKDPHKITLLKQQKLPFHEQEFTEFSRKIFEDGNYSISEKVVPADVFIICVPTPLTSDKKCDCKYIISACEEIAPILQKNNLVILESTVTPMTCENTMIPILEKSKLKANSDFFVAHAPERLLPGNILHEIIYNDRIIGGVNDKATQMTKELYSSFSKGQILLTDARTAEMCKLMENTYRDVNIALANEMALICESLGIDTYESIRMANHHPRVNILNPGPGVGGHCIAIDPWFIVEKAPKIAKLITQARIINDEQPNYVAKKILEMLKDIKNPKVALLGVAYKSNVDDPRESPSNHIIDTLEQNGVDVIVSDPVVKRYHKKPLLDLNEVFRDVDCILYVVNHDIFQQINIKKVASQVKSRKIFICGNFGNVEKWRKADFDVEILGIKKN